MASVICGCYGLNCAPQKRRVEVLTPSASECDLVNLEIGSYRGSQVKTKSLGWVLIWDERCPYKKREFGLRPMCTEGGQPYEREAWMRLRAKKGLPTTKGQEKAWKRPSPKA